MQKTMYQVIYKYDNGAFYSEDKLTYSSNEKIFPTREDAVTYINDKNPNVDLEDWQSPWEEIITNEPFVIRKFCRLSDDELKETRSYEIHAVTVEDGTTAAIQWIPVSERLPEKRGWYLVTTESYGKPRRVTVYDFVLNYHGQPGFIDTNEEQAFGLIPDVIAWAEFPAPCE